MFCCALFISLSHWAYACSHLASTCTCMPHPSRMYGNTCHMHVHVQMHMCLCLYTCRYELLLWTCCWPDKHGTCMYMYMYMCLGLVIVCMHVHVCTLLTEGILLSFCCVQLCVPCPHACGQARWQPADYNCLFVDQATNVCVWDWQGPHALLFLFPGLALLCIQ